MGQGLDPVTASTAFLRLQGCSDVVEPSGGWQRVGSELHGQYVVLSGPGGRGVSHTSASALIIAVIRETSTAYATIQFVPLVGSLFVLAPEGSKGVQETGRGIWVLDI